MGAPLLTPKRGSKPQNFGPPILLSLKSLELRVLPFSTPSLLGLSLSPFSPFHGLWCIFNWIELTLVFHHINYLLLLHKLSIALKFHWATISLNVLTILTQSSFWQSNWLNILNFFSFSPLRIMLVFNLCL